MANTFEAHDGSGIGISTPYGSPTEYFYDESQRGTATPGYTPYDEYTNRNAPILNQNWNRQDPFGDANPFGSPIGGPTLYRDVNGGYTDPLKGVEPYLRGANIGNVLSNELYNRQANLQSANPYSEGAGHGRLLDTLAALRRSAQGSRPMQSFGTTARSEQVRQQQPMLLGNEARGRFALGEAERLRGINDLSLQNRNQQVGLMSDFLNSYSTAQGQVDAAARASASQLGAIPIIGPLLAADRTSKARRDPHLASASG